MTNLRGEEYQACFWLNDCRELFEEEHYAKL